MEPNPLPRAASRALTCAASLALVLLAGSGAWAQPRPSIGLVPSFAHRLTEAPIFPHAPGAADRFGAALAVGDFNGDGAADLAVGIPDEDCTLSDWDCGSVSIQFGTVGCGFYCSQALFLDPGAEGSPDAALPFERYGAALAAGDFDCDGYDDLAVGVPGNVTPPFGITGSVQIHRGLPGLSGSIEWVASQSLAPGVGGFPAQVSGQNFEALGRALAAGDFNGDGCDDLAIGDPLEDHHGENDAGRVYIAHGHPYNGADGGLVPYAGFLIEKGIYDVPGLFEDHDQFGWSLAVGDFSCDGVDDLAIGQPGEDYFLSSGPFSIGGATIVYGSLVHSLILTADSGVPAPQHFDDDWLGGALEDFDRFGEVLAAGDFDGDTCDDLAFGTPYEDVSGTDEGFAVIAYGTPEGITTTGATRLGETSLLGAGMGESLDHFGSALVVGDFNRDSVDDLAIGIPGEDFNEEAFPFRDAGAVAVVLGRRDQPMPGRARQLFPRQTVPDGPHAGMIQDAQFGTPAYGAALAAGDFDGNGQSDLAIGAPGGVVANLAGAGAVAIVYGHLFIDGFETQDAFEWSAGNATVAP